VIGNGLPVQIELSPGQMNDQPMAELLLHDLPAGADVIGYLSEASNWISNARGSPDVIRTARIDCHLFPDVWQNPP
jgi:hypothetical protein